MKSILLHVHNDDAMESRLQVALDLARRHGAHLTCIQIMPIQDYLIGAPMGGFAPTGELVEEMQEIQSAHRKEIEERLKREEVRWDWLESMSDVVSATLTASALADLLIVSQHSGHNKLKMPPLPIVDNLAAHTRCAMLVVPAHIESMAEEGPVVIGWNGSVEAAHALRQALPLLASATSVDIVAVGNDDGEFSQVAASQYLSRHGIASELHVVPVTGGSVANTLHRFCQEHEANMLLLGAYGHSRLREALLGGTTRDLLENSRIPLLLGH